MIPPTSIDLGDSVVRFDDILGRLLEQHDQIERQAQKIEQLERTVVMLRKRLRATEEHARQLEKSHGLATRWRF